MQSLAASFIAVAIAMGAFGAHALRGTLDPAMMKVYETAVFYHLVNAVGLYCVVSRPTFATEGPLAARILTAGIIIFSGSLYLLSISGIKRFGMITPVGGILLIVGWALIALAARRSV